MAEALHRMTYDASVDEVVDASWRLASRTRAFQRQIRNHVIIASAATGVVVFGVWTYFGRGTGGQIAVALIAATVFAVTFARFFRGELVKQLKKSQRTIALEQFGGKPVPCEVELRPDGLWVRQAEMEMIFPWTVCTGIVENTDDIEINFSPGICVLRNRHFALPTERQAFLDTVRRLAGR